MEIRCFVAVKFLEVFRLLYLKLFLSGLQNDFGMTAWQLYKNSLNNLRAPVEDHIAFFISSITEFQLRDCPFLKFINCRSYLKQISLSKFAIFTD
jgi:hypothetical protein